MTEPEEYVQHFHSSINEFPVKTTEDQQNERLRKIHTFQASFDDFVSYVNQRIEDTKFGQLPQEKNNLIKENMNILDFENFVINESVKEWNLITEGVQSSIIRSLLNAIDTSNNSKFTSFISLFKGKVYGQLAWDQIQDTDFETYTVKGVYPLTLGWREKFNTKNIAPEDKDFVSALKKAFKNNGLSIYLKDDEVKAISFGEYWYTFNAMTEVDDNNPEVVKAREAENEYYRKKREREANGDPYQSPWDDPEYQEISKQYHIARKNAEKTVNTWRPRNSKDFSEGIWAQILVNWGVNKMCILRDTSKFEISQLQKDRRTSQKGIVDLSPEGLEKIAKANMERYKKIVAQKKANNDDAFAKQDKMFMDTIMEGMKTLMEIRSSREKILTKGNWISRAADSLDTLMGCYENFVRDSNRYVETLARYQERGREYDEDWMSERKDMEETIERFKKYKVEFDGYIAQINAD